MGYVSKCIVRDSYAEGALTVLTRQPQEQVVADVDEPDDNREVETARFVWWLQICLVFWFRVLFLCSFVSKDVVF